MPDRINIAVRERPLSTDINNLQAIIDRTVMNLMRYGLGFHGVGVQTDYPLNHVVGGLLASPSGSDISISPGVLVQDSAVLPPTPGTYDSTYRIGTLFAAETIVMPSPGVETYYLIEAQMLDAVSSSVSRDVLNPGTGVFVPTSIPKVYTSGVTFQLLTGGANAPLPSGGDWIPIAIIRRPGGGGPVVAATDIIDARPIADWRQRPAFPDRLGCRIVTTPVPSDFVVLMSDYDGAFGRRMYLNNGGGAPYGSLDPTAASVLSPSTVIAASTKYYLYLASWSAQAINPRYTPGTVYAQEGVLVLSSVTPDEYTRTNSASIALPAPFAVGGYAAAAGTAYYLGTLIRNSLDTGWVPSTQIDGNVMLGADVGGFIAPFATSFAPPVGAAANAILASALPITARSVKYELTWNGGAGAPAPYTVSYRPTGTTDVLATFIVDDGTAQTVVMEVPINYGSALNDLYVSTAAVDAATVARVAIVGWQE